MIKKSLLISFFNTLFVSCLIFVGSRKLAHFDAALVGYTFATLFSIFAISYRYTMWLQRPPTALYWRRGLELMFDRKHLLSNILFIANRLVVLIFGNSFIWKRSKIRGLGHWLIMWGCFLAAAITFPLVFGWLHFMIPSDDIYSYQIISFGFPLFSFEYEATIGKLIFHGLVFSSFLVLAGVGIAFYRRFVDRGAFILQTFSEDIMPLLLLFAISITGLFLTISYTWLKGYGYTFLSILHALTVIFTLLALPFGKFFHIFMRPAQFGVALYKKYGQEELAECLRCRQKYTSQMHVNDLIKVQTELGYKYNLKNSSDHYQQICPQCRRKLLGLVQGAIWHGDKQGNRA